MRGLKICLWIAGVGCLLMVFGMFLPLSTIESMLKFCGLESIPDSPMFEYAARLMSATYAAVGVFFIILALNPTRYGVMVPFSGVGAVFVGVVCGVAGLIAGIPTWWLLGDSLSCLVLGVLVLVFWNQVKQSSAALT